MIRLRGSAVALGLRYMPEDTFSYDAAHLIFYSICLLECNGEKLMPKTETSSKWLRGTSSDLTDIDGLIAGGEVTYSNDKRKPRFKLFPEGNVAPVVTELSLRVGDAVKEVTVLPNGKEPTVSLFSGHCRIQPIYRTMRCDYLKMLGKFEVKYVPIYTKVHLKNCEGLIN